MQETAKPTTPPLKLRLPTVQIPDMTLEKVGSLLFPGYFLLSRLTNTRSKLRLFTAWGLRIGTEVGNGFAYGSIASLFFKAVTGSITGLGWFGVMALMPSILARSKGFLMYYICDIPKLEAQYTASLTQDVFRALRLRPEVPHQPIVQKLLMLSRKVNILVRGQLHLSYANSLAPTILALTSGGAYKQGAVLALFLLKATLSFLNKKQRSVMLDYINYMRGVQNQVSQLEHHDHMGGRQEFLLNDIAGNLRAATCQRQKTTWHEFFAKMPLEALSTAAITIIQALIKGISHFSNLDFSEFISNVSMQYLTAASTFHTIQGIKDVCRAIEEVQSLETFAEETFKRHKTINPPEGYYEAEKNLVLQAVCYVAGTGATSRTLYRNISLVFRPGIYWLKGKNGTGKSSLLKMISGELKPTSGSVSLGTIETRRLSPEARDRVTSYAPQDTTYHEKRSVLYNILYRLGENLFPESRLKQATSCRTAAALRTSFQNTPILRRIDRAAKILGISLLLDRNSAKELSGGEKKILMFLVSMLRAHYQKDSTVVLLDEITAGMDDEKINTVKRVLPGKYFRGKIVIVTTHEAGIFAGNNPVPFNGRYKIADQNIRAVA